MLDEAFSQQRFPTVRELAEKAIDPFIKKNLSTLRRGATASWLGLHDAVDLNFKSQGTGSEQ